MPNNPWQQQCLENIKRMPDAVPCDELRCDDELTPFLHQICNCLPPYTNGCAGPHPPANCCAYSATTPIVVFRPDGPPCYCCCGGRSYQPMLTVAAGEMKANHELNVGDPVLTASDASLKSWTQRPLAFSSGIGPDPGNPMIKISFGEKAGPAALPAGRNQVFLLADGKLKRASRLVPGKDELVRPDGTAVPITGMASHVSTRGVHQIALSTGPATEIGGHLVIVNGVVCGDYALELADLEGKLPQALAAGHATLPEFGSAAYARRHSG